MRLFITTVVAALAVAGVASAQTTPAAKPATAPGQYVSVSAGLAGSSDYHYKLIPGYDLKGDVDSGVQGEIAWGTQVDGGWRVQLALGYRTQDSKTTITGLSGSYDDAKIKTVILAADAYYDFPVKGPVKPYLGAGVGVAGVKFDDGVLDDKGSGLALRAMAGASYQITPTIALFAEGRYEHIGSLKVEVEYGTTTSKSTVNLSSFGGLAGVRFGF